MIALKEKRKSKGVEDNKKAIKFQEYMVENDMGFFGTQSLNDEQETVLFRTQIPVCGQTLPLVIIIDTGMVITIRVQVVSKVDKRRKSTIVSLFNDIHSKYKLFKYYLQDDGVIYMDMYVPTSEHGFEPKVIHMLLDSLVHSMEEVFPDIMKFVWGK